MTTIPPQSRTELWRKYWEVCEDLNHDFDETEFPRRNALLYEKEQLELQLGIKEEVKGGVRQDGRKNL